MLNGQTGDSRSLTPMMSEMAILQQLTDIVQENSAENWEVHTKLPFGRGWRRLTESLVRALCWSMIWSFGSDFRKCLGPPQEFPRLVK